MAASAAATTLANSANMLSPVLFTTRPPCSLIAASKMARCAVRSSSVPESSWPMSREYPATSAIRMAVRRRSFLTLGGIPDVH